MSTAKTDRPYFDAWLRRTGRRLAASGILTQTAFALAAKDGDPIEIWRGRLRDLLDGKEMPSLELLTRIDALLVRPLLKNRAEEYQHSLF